MPKWISINKKLTNTLCSVLIYNCLLAWLAIILFCLVSIAARSILLIHYLHEASHQDLIHYYLLSLRSDLLTSSYLFTPLYIFGALSCALKNKFFTQILYPGFFAILLAGTTFLAISNYYYFGVFANHFDEHLFDSRGDLLPTLIAIWKDYPVVTAAITSLCYGFIGFKLMRRLAIKLEAMPSSKNYLINLIILFEFLLLYVNSFHAWGVQPLFWQYGFSKNTVINNSSINPDIALFDALKRNQSDVIDQEFKNLSLEQGAIYYKNYFSSSLAEKKFSPDQLFTHTPRNAFLEKNPPNVIFVQMESMGRHFLLFDKAGYNDLWGSLRPHLQRDTLFSSFLSGHNETSGSLTELVINSPLNFSFNSRLNQIQYSTNISKAFKNAGYKTIFLTSAQLGWLNLAGALKKQGFDQVIGAHQILKEMPSAIEEWWGVYDEYTLDYALHLLKKAQEDHQPLFIYINTATNHAFYMPPLHYKAAPTHPTPALAKRMNISEFKLKNMLKTYQYTNNVLGDFIDAVEKSSFGGKTIIGASGDHNQHEMKNTYDGHDDELALKHAVYFFLHVPEAYKPGKKFDTERAASHKDIFPTLYNLALSNAKYPNFGSDLALSEAVTPFEFGLNENMLLLDEGIIPLNGPEPFFHPWKDGNHILVGKAQILTEKQKILLERVKAYNALRTWAQGWEYKNKVLDKISH